MGNGKGGDAQATPPSNDTAPKEGVDSERIRDDEGVGATPVAKEKTPGPERKEKGIGRKADVSAVIADGSTLSTPKAPKANSFPSITGPEPRKEEVRINFLAASF